MVLIVAFGRRRRKIRIVCILIPTISIQKLLPQVGPDEILEELLGQLRWLLIPNHVPLTQLLNMGVVCLAIWLLDILDYTGSVG